jgi:type VI secretion system secreted protein VgrG
VKLFDEGFVLKDKETGKLLANVPYRIKLPDGSFEEGITDAQGRTHVVRGTDSGPVEIQTKKG